MSSSFDGARPNNAFKPQLHRHTVHMAGKAAHAVGCALQFGSTQVLGRPKPDQIAIGELERRERHAPEVIQGLGKFMESGSGEIITCRTPRLHDCSFKPPPFAARSAADPGASPMNGGERMDLQDFEQFMAIRKTASDAFVAGDPGPLRAISATHDPATLFGPRGDCVRGAADVMAANERGAGRFQPGGSNEFEVMHSNASGDIAYWVGIQRSVVELRGQTPGTPMDLRVTEIFRRDQGTWKLVHRHADTLAAP